MSARYSCLRRHQDFCFVRVFFLPESSTREQLHAAQQRVKGVCELGGIGCFAVNPPAVCES